MKTSLTKPVMLDREMMAPFIDFLKKEAPIKIWIQQAILNPSNHKFEYRICYQTENAKAKATPDIMYFILESEDDAGTKL